MNADQLRAFATRTPAERIDDLRRRRAPTTHREPERDHERELQRERERAAADRAERMGEAIRQAIDAGRERPRGWVTHRFSEDRGPHLPNDKP